MTGRVLDNEEAVLFLERELAAAEAQVRELTSARRAGEALQETQEREILTLQAQVRELEEALRQIHEISLDGDEFDRRIIRMAEVARRALVPADEETADG